MEDPSAVLASYWSRDPNKVAALLGSSDAGLTPEKRAAKLAASVGRKSTKGNSAWATLLGQFKSPILLLLLAAGCLSFILREPADAGVIMAIIFASAAMGFQHEYRAGRAVAKLLELVQTRTVVLIDGKETLVPSDQVVPGDVIVVSAGSMVPGDALLLESSTLFVDQAALTGESFPVDKAPGTIEAEAPVSSRKNVLFAGSHVASGSGKALVINVGADTELGSIATTLRAQRPETEFEHGIHRFGVLLIELTILLTLGVFMVNLFRRQPPLESFLFALALAVGLTPQLLPAIISVNLSRGAVEMAREQVITKRLSAIENLGSMTVLCSDKTGTLTLGVVRVHEACDTSGQQSADVLRLAQLNAAFQTGFTNPIDDALKGQIPADVASQSKAIGEVPYDFLRKRLSVAIMQGEDRMIITKGALEQVLSVSDQALSNGSQRPLSEVREVIESLYHTYSDSGYRVLGVATRKLAEDEKSISPESEYGMTFQGFVVLEDPLRPEIAETIARLKSLGVALKVITGDNRLVAQRLGSDLGLSNASVLTGEELHRTSDRALIGNVAETNIFAEIEPHQKERIVLALKKRGFVVGYIGDGINDGAALHAADAGISVANAVDVAKEAADFVMLEPGLGVLTNAILEGRKTFSNTMKYIFMATSANFGNMFSLAGASLLINFLPLLPKQVLLMNLVTDIPEMAIASDSVDPDQLSSPLRWDLGLLRKFMIVFGILSSAFDYATFAVLLALRAPQAEFQTAWFVESVISACLIVLVVRSRKPFLSSRPGLALRWATIGVVVVTALLPFSPIAGTLGMAALPATILALIGSIVVCYVIAAEVTKRWFWRSTASGALR